MKYLLDVNTLVAWHHPSAPDHESFHTWRKANAKEPLLSCAITELGFVRVSMQVFRYRKSEAYGALEQMKGHMRFVSEMPAPRVPQWIVNAAQTTDAYLSQLAAHHRAKLLTFDKAIPGATLISA